MSQPTAEEAASFEWGGTRARPRKKIEKVVKKDAVYLKPPGSCNSKWTDVSVSINIECCENSTITILDTTAQVQISDCVNCRIIVGPCVGSVFLLDCLKCNVSVAAKQLRLRDCFDCTLRNFAPTSESIVIETCKDLRFGAWEVAYPGLAAQFATVPDWDPAVNYWDKIYDFSPPTEATAPRNYSLLPKNAALLEEQGMHRWSELTLTSEGLTDGTVVETKSAALTIEGCECPCISADGKKYEAAPKLAPPIPSDSVGSYGYAARYGGGGGDRFADARPVFAPAPAPPKPAAAPKPDAAVKTDDVELSEKAPAAPAPTQEIGVPGLLQKLFDFVGSFFGRG